MKTNNVIAIKATYEDGTEKEISKGVVAEIKGDTFSLDMVHFSTYDFIRLTYGVLRAVEEMGLSDALEAFINGTTLPDE